jgi:basic membrane protein A
MTYKEQEGGFMAGLAAALTSKSNKVAEINGMPFPSNTNYQFGFMGGVKYANEKFGTAVECVEIPSFSGGDGVGGNYVGNFADPATGKVVAETLIGDGCDVIFAAAGESGNGALTAVKEADGVWFIGCDVDQYDDGAKGDGNVVLTSALKVMHLDVQRELENIYNGTFAGTDALLGADSDSTGFVSAEGRQQLSDDALAKLAECYDLMKKGEIVPPTTADGVNDFPGLK